VDLLYNVKKGMYWLTKSGAMDH